MRWSFGKPALLLGALAVASMPATSARFADATSPSPAPSVIVLVVDGLEPETVTTTLMPNLTGLVQAGQARSYSDAKAIMVTETNPNHTAMLTGSYSETSGLVANHFFNSRSGAKEPMERPSLIMSPTLFDAIEAQAPELRTASIMGKEKLRRLFDCTRTPAGTCGPSADNPEGVTVEHRRPDFVGGANTSFDPDAIHDDALAEPASVGYALDNEVMDIVIAKATSSQPPHFTFVNLGVVDGFQHIFGARSAEGLAAVANADANVGRLVSALKDSGRWDDTVLFVLADHSFQESGNSVGHDPLHIKNPVTPFVTGMQVVLPEVLGTCDNGTPFSTVTNGGSAFVYLRSPGFDGYAATSLTSAQKECLKQLRAKALARPAVSEALYRLPVESDPVTTVSGAHPDWKLESPRIGELLVISSDQGSFLESRSSSQVINTGVHGGPSTRPIPFFVASGSSLLSSGTDSINGAGPIDVAPTVAWLLGISPPSGSKGRVLCEAFLSCP